MPALKNAKHEKFVQAYMRGKHEGNAARCYKEVFGTNNRTSAYKLLHRADIVCRINELRKQVEDLHAVATERAIEELAISKERIMAELARMGFANMLDYIRPKANGTVTVDLAALDRDKATAIQEVTVDAIETDDGPRAFRVRFKLCDKRAALIDLAKLAGFYAEAPANVNIIAGAVIDRPPQETFKQWEARRLLELKPATNGKGNGHTH